MKINEFKIELERLSIDYDQEKLDLLEKYYEILVEWNSKMNLTAITDKEEVYLKHFYDSLTIVKAIDLDKELNLCDVGSGAGFPGIVLKIFFPKLKITLVDSLNKRVKFLNSLIEELGLKGIKAYHYRMEDFSRKNEEKFDIITARAVAQLCIINEISVRALKIGGNFIYLKANIDGELENARQFLKKLALEEKEIISFKLFKGEIQRTIVQYKKIFKTNKVYPRSIDKIKRDCNKNKDVI